MSAESCILTSYTQLANIDISKCKSFPDNTYTTDDSILSNGLLMTNFHADYFLAIWNKSIIKDNQEKEMNILEKNIGIRSPWALFEYLINNGLKFNIEKDKFFDLCENVAEILNPYNIGLVDTVSILKQDGTYRKYKMGYPCKDGFTIQIESLDGKYIT
jgi:hypothetical protein